MHTVVTILLTVVMFGILIFIHEFGHFITAKLFKVKVNEFALGMGPKLFSFGKGETRYSLRLLPIGGYVSMEGETEDSDDPRAFKRQKVWKRIIIFALPVKVWVPTSTAAWRSTLSAVKRVFTSFPTMSVCCPLL